MLLEKLNECRILIDEVSRNKMQNQENQNIAKRNNTFFDSLENKFLPTIKSYDMISDIDNFALAEDTKEELNNLKEYIIGTFEKKAVVNAEKFQRNVKKVCEKIEKEWEIYFYETNEKMLDDLGVLKVISNNKMEISRITSRINKYKEWPVNEEVKDFYLESKEKAYKILNEMEFDEEIEEFLIKVRDKEATLNDLTDSVIEWIRKEDLSSNIMLSIKIQN